jgi:hypothetical protein
MSVYLSIRLSICPSNYPSVYLSVCPSVCPSVCRSIRLSVCRSVRPSICLSVYLCAWHNCRTAEGTTVNSTLSSVVLVATFWGAFLKFRKATVSFVMSVRSSARNNLTPTARIFMKFDIWVYLEKCSKKKFSLKCHKMALVCFTWRPAYLCDHTSPNCSYSEKCFT